MEIMYVTMAVVFSFFSWAFLHELSHGMAVKKYNKDITVSYKIYPHVEEGLGFVWASVSWIYPPGFKLTSNQKGWVSFAPRIIDIIGILITILLSVILPHSSYKLYALILAGGSIFDLLWGSIGHSSTSDLQRYCKHWGWNVTWTRAIGISIGILSIIISALFL